MTDQSKIVNVHQLATQFGIDRTTVLTVIQKAKVRHVGALPAGRGTMLLYDRADAVPPLEAYMAKRRPVAPPPAAAEPAESADAKALGAIEILDEKVTAAMEQLKQQNLVLFRMFERMAGEIATLVRHADRVNPPLPAAAGSAPAPVDAPAPKHDPQQVAPAKKALPRVVIVGLLPDQTQLISKEFSEVFDLRFYAADDAKGRAFESAVANCDAAVTMTNFISHRIEDCVRATRVRHVRVTGGMTTLRDKLTNLFVEVSE